MNRLTVILGIVAGVLLLAFVAVLFLLIGRGMGDPAAAPTPTPTPTTPSPTPTESETPSESPTPAPPVDTRFTPSKKDAKDDAYMRFPNPNAGTQNDLTDEHLFPCNHDRRLDVTITLVGPNGEHVSKHVVYEDVNWGR